MSLKNEYDAVNIKYVENLLKNLNKSLTTLNELYNRLKKQNEEDINNINQNFTQKEDFEKRTNLISVAASFQGAFTKGEYPFIFGGPNYGDKIRYNMFNGFLMPYSGYVKRFVLKGYGLKVFKDFIDGGFIESGRELPLLTLVLITKPHVIDLVTINLFF